MFHFYIYWKFKTINLQKRSWNVNGKLINCASTAWSVILEQLTELPQHNHIPYKKWHIKEHCYNISRFTQLPSHLLLAWSLNIPKLNINIIICLRVEFNLRPPFITPLFQIFTFGKTLNFNFVRIQKKS
jgi:hypothetical protein